MGLTRRAMVTGVPALAVLVLAGCTSDNTPRSVYATGQGAAAPTPTPTPTPTFDKGAHSIDDPTSIWVVVDSARPLHPLSYVPPDLVSVQVPHTNLPRLRKESATAVERMFAAASRQGVGLVSTSTYRSLQYQKTIIAQDTAAYGATYAKTFLELPGCSEHQTGWAIDIGSSTEPKLDFDAGMAATPEGKWLASNAWRYGFNLSYPKNRESITGISYEPWHFRYVGTTLASELHRTGIETLQEFFGLPATPMA